MQRNNGQCQLVPSNTEQQIIAQWPVAWRGDTINFAYCQFLAANLPAYSWKDFCGGGGMMFVPS